MKVIWQNVSMEEWKDLLNKDWTWLPGLTGEKPSRAKGTENCEENQALGMATNFVPEVYACIYGALRSSADHSLFSNRKMWWSYGNHVTDFK